MWAAEVENQCNTRLGKLGAAAAKMHYYVWITMSAQRNFWCRADEQPLSGPMSAWCQKVLNFPTCSRCRADVLRLTGKSCYLHVYKFHAGSMSKLSRSKVGLSHSINSDLHRINPYHWATTGLLRSVIVRWVRTAAWRRFEPSDLLITTY